MLNAQGQHAGVALYGAGQYAVCTENGPELRAIEPLLSGTP